MFLFVFDSEERKSSWSSGSRRVSWKCPSHLYFRANSIYGLKISSHIDWTFQSVIFFLVREREVGSVCSNILNIAPRTSRMSHRRKCSQINYKFPWIFTDTICSSTKITSKFNRYSELKPSITLNIVFIIWQSFTCPQAGTYKLQCFPFKILSLKIFSTTFFIQIYFYKHSLVYY